MRCFGSRVFRANKAEVFVWGRLPLVHGCLDASVLFSGEDWVAVAVRTVSKQDRVLKSALTGKNGVALQAVSGRCQGHVANVQHVQFRPSKFSSTSCLNCRSSTSSRSGANF